MDESAKRNVETPADILARLSELNREKGREYGNSYKRHGPVMAAFFPEGLVLRNAEDFARFALFDLMVVKMVRYTVNWQKGHPDSLDDLAVYTAMLRETDNGR